MPVPVFLFLLKGNGNGTGEGRDLLSPSIPFLAGEPLSPRPFFITKEMGGLGRDNLMRTRRIGKDKEYRPTEEGTDGIFICAGTLPDEAAAYPKGRDGGVERKDKVDVTG